MLKKIILIIRIGILDDKIRLLFKNYDKILYGKNFSSILSYRKKLIKFRERRNTLKKRLECLK